MPTFFVSTFGCQMNAHDSSRMQEVLLRSGYRNASSPEEADVVLLNTCSIREKAEQKLRSEVGRLGQLKKRRPGLVIGVAGCVAQQEGERLLKSLPQIDLIVGPDNIRELPHLLADVESGGLPQVRTVFDVEEPSFLNATPRPFAEGACAYVTVMKGCNERCSYCIVPYTRGPERYRPAPDIIAECARFVEAGVREITLLGQTVNSYKDPSDTLPPARLFGQNRWMHTRGARAVEDETQFPALLRAIGEQVPGLVRLRYTSPHPRHLTSSLIAAHQDLPLLCRHVHLPVQSGSDAQLRKMIRRYTIAEYLERTDALREAVPDLTLSTDMIVGFSGETEQDFEESLELVRRVGFVSLYGFTYSERPYTPALKLTDDVSPEEKSRRLSRLFAVVDAQKSAHLDSLVGTEQEVLVDGHSKTGGLCGRSERNEIVHITPPQLGLSADFSAHGVPASSDGVAHSHDAHDAHDVHGVRPGAVVRVRVTRAFKNSLQAEVLSTILPAADSAQRRGGMDAGANTSRTHTGAGNAAPHGRRQLLVVS